MKMNALVILIFLIASDRAFSGKNKAKCLEDGDITTEELKIMKKSSIPDLKLKCFYRCILEKDQLIANNKIIPGAFKKLVGPRIPPKKVDQVESKCHSQDSRIHIKDDCDFGHVMYKCYNSLVKTELQLWLKKNPTLNISSVK